MSPGHVVKYPASMAFFQVEMTGLKAARCRKCTEFAFVVMS